MKNLLLAFLMGLTFNINAELVNGVWVSPKSSSTSFNYTVKAVTKAHQKICSKVDKPTFNFSKLYYDLNSSSYLNDDVTGIKEISQAIDKAYKQECKEKGFFQFGIQNCYHACHAKYKPELTLLGNPKENKVSRLNDLCVGTCSALQAKFDDYMAHINEFYQDEGIKNDICKEDYRGVNNTGRNVIKDVDQVADDVSNIVNEATNR